jgi:hypothetical protein
VRHATDVFASVVPGQVKAFRRTEAAEAPAWAAA